MKVLYSDSSERYGNDCMIYTSVTVFKELADTVYRWRIKSTRYSAQDRNFETTDKEDFIESLELELHDDSVIEKIKSL